MSSMTSCISVRKASWGDLPRSMNKASSIAVRLARIVCRRALSLAILKAGIFVAPVLKKARMSFIMVGQLCEAKILVM